jgi:tRNA threonylcarbamoyladenosine biosynthesis protein TsaB
MLILTIDTSGRIGAVALARGAGEGVAVLEAAVLSGGQYSARLIPELSGLLARQQLGKQDLEAFIVVSGPGSFTGLRVGLAAVKGLAEILGGPIAAVSMLEAIAAHGGHDGRIIAAMDAGRKELYTGEFQMRDGTLQCERESLLTQAEFLALLQATPDAELITPDLAVGELAGAHLHVRQIEWPGAAEIARLGWSKIQQGQTVAPEVLEANYIRRSDAEIFSKPRN